jgi:hypothetical protein
METLSEEETEALLKLMLDAFWAASHDDRILSDPARMRAVYEALQTYFNTSNPLIPNGTETDRPVLPIPAIGEIHDCPAP